MKYRYQIWLTLIDENGKREAVTASKTGDWCFPFPPTPGMELDNRRVEYVRLNTKAPDLITINFQSGYRAQTLAETKSDYEGWEIHGRQGLL